jgi:Putative beta-lactamase-inhibitor-like, PepSY-like
MKNISLSLAALVLSIASVKTSHAQSNAMFASNIVVMNNNDNNGNNATEAGVDARALKNFKKEFSTVENAKWEQLSDGYFTKFVQKNIQFKIGYNHKGEWQYTERTYTAATLPVDVKRTVQSAYIGYNINLVEEITVSQRTVYIVHIDNDEWSMKIKVDGNETESMEEFKK